MDTSQEAPLSLGWGSSRYFVKHSLFAKPEILPNQDKIKLEIPKTYVEQFLLQAIGGSYVGAGNYPIDLIKDLVGIDAKSLTCKINKNNSLSDTDSGEASIGQNFSDAGDYLDKIFENKEFEKALKEWNHIIKNKYLKVKNERNLTDIIYIFLLNAHTRFYICGCKLNESLIDSVEVKSATEKSITSKGFIDENLGSVKLYKSKKRLELRLRPKKWVDDGFCFEIPIPQDYSKDINLREADLKEIENIKIKNITSASKEKEFRIKNYFKFEKDSWSPYLFEKDYHSSEYSITTKADGDTSANLLLNSEKKCYVINIPNNIYYVMISIEDKKGDFIFRQAFKENHVNKIKIIFKVEENQIFFINKNTVKVINLTTLAK